MSATSFSMLLLLVAQVGTPAHSEEVQQAPETVSAVSRNQVAEVRRVIINRVRLSDQEVAALEQMYQVRLIDGGYWYDGKSGAWGIEGGPTLGFVLPGVKMGGPLRADASNGNTRVFINGRELHFQDVAGLQRLGPVFPGRYWVDALGNCGFEGGPAFVNLIALARSRGQVHYGRNGTVGVDGNGTPFFQGRDALGRDGSFYR